MQARDDERAVKMMGLRWAACFAGVFLLLLALWQIRAAGQGIRISTLPGSMPPVSVMEPREEGDSPRPVVLVGHGFAGSAVVMRGFGLALAHAGYTAVLWDFSGHGANPQPLSMTGSGEALLEDAETALAQYMASRGREPGGEAILGHSMGSGVALDFGLSHPETRATIAISPVLRDVTESLPHNLLLMAGALEPRFAANAESLLAQAGGAGGDPVSGNARRLIIIPGVEHISILFSPPAQQSAADWLDGTFGTQPGAIPYTDRRILWYLVAIAGVLLASVAGATIAADLTGSRQIAPASAGILPLWRRLAALASGVIAASLLLWLAGAAGLQLSAAFGLLIGGYLLLWLGAAGTLALLALGMSPGRITRQELVGGLIVFGVLWLGVGLLGQMVWLHWLLVPKRLLLWPLGTALLLPWFLAVGEGSGRARGPARAGWWLAHSALLLGGLLLALNLDPSLSFLILILPLLPVLLGLHTLAAAPYRGSWAYSLSGAMFLSWTILAVFPLV